jgi:hypothetical protein
VQVVPVVCVQVFAGVASPPQPVGPSLFTLQHCENELLSGHVQNVVDPLMSKQHSNVLELLLLHPMVNAARAMAKRPMEVSSNASETERVLVRNLRKPGRQSTVKSGRGTKLLAGAFLQERKP